MNAQPPPSDPALRISYVRLVDTLRAGLPPPLSNTPGQSGPPSEYAIARRDAAAFAMIASLDPADAIEADLAVQYVVASAHATHALHQARQHPPSSEAAIKLRGQSAQLEQDAQCTRSLLRARQVARRRRQAADAVARKTAARSSPGQSAGGGLASQGGAAVAPPAQPPAPPEETKPAAPRRSPPALRIIQGGLAS